MPRIDDKMLDVSVYLYPTRENALEGAEAGGSGFLLGVPGAHDAYHVYAVTNSHVIREGRSPVVRLSRSSGATHVLQFTTSDWTHHSDGDDVAVVALGVFSDSSLGFGYVTTELMATPERIQKDVYGIGDEVYMIGRFFAHSGRQQNRPAVRFGNISMMPAESVRHARGILQEAFLVEARSLSGFSGSPVFVHRPFAQVLPFGPDEQPKLRGPWVGEFLLGIDFGHLQGHEPVWEPDSLHPDRYRTVDSYTVRANSGLTAVIPAWRIMKLIDEPELADARRAADGAFAVETTRRVWSEAAARASATESST